MEDAEPDYGSAQLVSSCPDGPIVAGGKKPARNTAMESVPTSPPGGCFDSKAITATRIDRRASLGIHGPHRAAGLTTTPSATRNHLHEEGPQVLPDRRTVCVHVPSGDVAVRILELLHRLGCRRDECGLIPCAGHGTFHSETVPLDSRRARWFEFGVELLARDINQTRENSSVDLNPIVRRPSTFVRNTLVPRRLKQTKLVSNEMINKAGILRWGMVGIEPTPSTMILDQHGNKRPP